MDSRTRNARLYVPDETLPIFPGYSTQVIEGVKYKVYFETDWHQVMTEDGVTLCDLLANVPTSTERFYRYCGTLRSTPTQTAMQRLYAIVNPKLGDVYLVETDRMVETAYVCETYVWLNTWVYSGTTHRETSIDHDLPKIIKLFPDTLGEPDQILVVNKNGTGITWGNPVEDHNTSEKAHTDIRNSIDLKADKMIIVNDTLLTSKWVYNNSYPGFEYHYTNDNIPIGAYFEITPIINNSVDAKIITNSSISGVFEISTGSDKKPFAVFTAKRVPSLDIPICVKVFGTYNTK